MENSDYLAIAVVAVRDPPTPDSMDRRPVKEPLPSGFFFWQAETDPSVFAVIWQALLEGARRGFRMFASQEHAAAAIPKAGGRGRNSKMGLAQIIRKAARRMA